MVKEVTYTLLADGSSDRRLIPMLTWLLRQHYLDIAIKDQWADLSNMPKQNSLEKKIEMAMEQYPSHILFIHRDAERITHKDRVAEIRRAIEKIHKQYQGRLTVCVVPVRMQEAWLLIDGKAIRTAADNANGTVDIKLPRINELETIQDPKAELQRLLIEACEIAGGRKLKKFKSSISKRKYRVAENIADFSPLRELPAFQSLENELKEVLREMKLA
ncbi:MAG: DUF4276 family protein [Candidatus Magnetominusculus sp. LBB02]|nr:DUF4276 family protein [Candidatus Magnetominusculus sp. LBB02]